MSLVLFFGYLQSFAASGLSVSVYTRYLKYEHKPERRISIRTKGDLLNYREKKIEHLRERLNPRLDRIKKIIDFSKKNNSGVTEFDPNYPESFFDLKQYKKIDKIVFPSSLVFQLNSSDVSDGLEFVTISFSKKPSQEQLKNMLFSLEQIFKINLKSKDLTHLKGKRLTKEQIEMLEPIKKKAITFMKYQTYYAVRFKNTVWVETSFFNDLKSKYEGQFAQIQKDFKYYFYRSKEIDIAIKSEYLKNLEKSVEEDKFETLEEPFDKVNISNKYVRLDTVRNDVEIDFLFVRDPDKKSVEKALNEVLSQLK